MHVTFSESELKHSLGNSRRRLWGCCRHSVNDGHTTQLFAVTLPSNVKYCARNDGDKVGGKGQRCHCEIYMCALCAVRIRTKHKRVSLLYASSTIPIYLGIRLLLSLCARICEQKMWNMKLNMLRPRTVTTHTIHHSHWGQIKGQRRMNCNDRFT